MIINKLFLDMKKQIHDGKNTNLSVRHCISFWDGGNFLLFCSAVLVKHWNTYHKYWGSRKHSHCFWDSGSLLEWMKHSLLKYLEEMSLDLLCDRTWRSGPPRRSSPASTCAGDRGGTSGGDCWWGSGCCRPRPSAASSSCWPHCSDLPERGQNYKPKPI